MTSFGQIKKRRDSNCALINANIAGVDCGTAFPVLVPLIAPIYHAHHSAYYSPLTVHCLSLFLPSICSLLASFLANHNHLPHTETMKQTVCPPNMLQLALLTVCCHSISLLHRYFCLCAKYLAIATKMAG